MLRKSLHAKRHLKEKIVTLYSDIIKRFDQHEATNHLFWDEFFLLRANPNALVKELKSIEDFRALTTFIQKFIIKCLGAINDSNCLRMYNGLVTLSTLCQFVLLQKCNDTLPKPRNFLTFADVLFGEGNYQRMSRQLSNIMCNLLCNDVHPQIKSLVLRLYLIFLTGTPHLDVNLFIVFMMTEKLFDTLFEMIGNDVNDNWMIIILIAIAINYQKPSTNNIFIMKLSIVDNETCLSTYSRAILSELIHFNKTIDRYVLESKGVFSTFTSMVGTLFAANDNNTPDIAAILSKRMSLKTVTIALIGFFEAVLLNRNFISHLLITPEERSITSEMSIDSDEPRLDDATPQNLLVAFLEFTSISMFDLKDLSTLHSTRLCLLIITCITEDPCANSILHDPNITFTVNLKKMPMRHRKVSSGWAGEDGARPLCHALLDLLIDFLSSHLNRSIVHQHDLYVLVFGILRRLLCYQRRCHARIEYAWKDLWQALILAIKFFTTNDTYLLKQNCNIFYYCEMIVNLFNFFILYGDTFLAKTTYYDELYYEIVRMHTVFDNLGALVTYYINKEHQEKAEAAGKLNVKLANIKAIIAHLNAKIESESSSSSSGGSTSGGTLSEEQVMQIVQQNYDKITLKFQDGLDYFSPYNPIKKKECLFCFRLFRHIFEEIRNDKDVLVDAGEQAKTIQALTGFANLSIDGGAGRASPDDTEKGD